MEEARSNAIDTCPLLGPERREERGDKGTHTHTHGCQQIDSRHSDFIVIQFGTFSPTRPEESK